MGLVGEESHKRFLHHLAHDSTNTLSEFPLLKRAISKVFQRGVPRPEPDSPTLELQEEILDDFDECNTGLYVEVTLIVNGQRIEPKLLTGVKYSYDIDELLTFPLKIKDLTP